MTKKITILIVEDEYIMIRHLKKTILSLGYDTVLDAMSSADCISALDNNEVDLVILDINLNEKEKDGIWLGNYIKQNFGIPFIYITAYQTKDILNRAIENEPSAYLTKPFNSVSLIASIKLAIQKHTVLSQSKKQFLTVKENDYFVQVEFCNIDFIESKKNYLIVHCQDVKYRIRATIKDLIKRLPKDYFFQTHRSFIVNKSSVLKYNNSYLVVGDIEIPISLKFKDSLIDFEQ